MSPGLGGLFSALEHVERRRILTELARTKKPVTVPLDSERSIKASNPGSESVIAQIQLDVLHYHLPELAKHGYVTFDEDEHVVTRGPKFSEIRPFLDKTNGHGLSDDAARTGE